MNCYAMALIFQLLVVPTVPVKDDSMGFEISTHHVGISVPNLEESNACYHKALGFDVVQRATQGADKGMLVALLRRGNC